MRGDVQGPGKISGSPVSIHAPRVRGDCRPLLIPCFHVGFNSRPSCEGRPRAPLTLWTSPPSFNSRPSCEGRPGIPLIEALHLVSIHAPRVRGDHWGHKAIRDNRFNSRPSCEGRPARLPCGDSVLVSIHAPRVRGDPTQSIRITRIPNVSIHAPRVRGDPKPRPKSRPKRSFNSRPSCEGRPAGITLIQALHLVSIHAPRVRGDRRSTRSDGRFEFQFTPLV